MIVFWVRLSPVFSLSSLHPYLPSASYGTVCFYYLLISYFAFFLSKSNRFCKGLGALLGTLFHVEKSTEEIIKLQRNHLEKKMVWFSDSSFLLKKFLRYLHLPFLHHEFYFQILGLRQQLSAVLATSRARASLSLTCFLPLFLLYRTLSWHPALKTWVILGRLPSCSGLSWAERFLCAKG